MTAILTETQVASVRERYRPLIRRREVLEICEAFGIDRWPARKLIEGSSFEVIVLMRGGRRYYHRDQVIEVINNRTP